MNRPELVRSIIMDIIFTLLTCGLYNIYVQYKQIESMNVILQSQKYDFWKWLVFTVITCGLYHIYHEYRVSDDLAKILKESDAFVLVTVGLSVFGLTFLVDAIQQSKINEYFGSNQL